jgi:fluoroquinolone transport system permease protein
VNRLLLRGLWDCRIQFRNGFYYAAIAVALMLVGVLVWLPQEQGKWILPVVLLGNLATNGFYFLAAIVLLEKAERSLDAQLVTPLRGWEYLLAKLAALCLVSLIESVTIVAVAYGGAVDWAILAVGIVLMTHIFACFGFLLGIRYASINEFLFPSILATVLLGLPLLDLLDIWPSAVWYAHPLQGPLELISAGFEPQPAGGLVAATAVSLVWATAVFFACIGRFRHLAGR